MRRRRLGGSDLEVSALCLGSMTWGSQNSEDEGHAQIDRALDAGITFIDTAETYPTTPSRPETMGRTEEIVGSWIAKNRARRDGIVIATKVAGPTEALRNGRGIHPDTVTEAVESSLARLRTDVIDLYQLHWPNRGSYHFRKYWSYDPSGQDRSATEAHMAGVLDTLARLQRHGKIRHVGLSNETAWGAMEWLRLAGETGGPRMITIQNEYSLLCRLFDTDLAEVALNEQVDLICYSPLAAGLLSGKYRGGAMPPGSRGAINGTLGGRLTDRAHAAVEVYADIAARHGLDLVQMALAWAMERPFMGSVIFGATSPEQLECALGAAELTLTDAVRAEIDAAYKAHPMPF